MSILSSDSILIKLEKNNYKPGDTINGTLELNLKEPLKANNISIELIGIKKNNSTSISSSSINYNSSTEYFFKNSLKIKGEGEYESQKIDFSYNISKLILPKSFGGITKIGKLPSWAIDILNLIIQLLGARNNDNYDDIEFSLIGRVDIPWGIDITEKVYVNIEQED